MYLERMQIIESIGNKLIRNVNFKKGLNIIVDNSSDSDVNSDENNGQGNNVGKTTFLKLIDICLGAKDKKYIWTDNDTGSETTSLKNYINEKKVITTLEFIKDKTAYLLQVELFEKGKKYINGKHYSQPKYVEELNKIIFGIEKPPSFRQLIGKFVRIKQTEDTNAFLKYLHNTTTNAEYKNIYDFLFKLSPLEESEMKLNLNRDIEQIKKDIAQIIKVHKFSNIVDLNERIRIIKNTVKELEQKVNSLVDVKEYEKNIDIISQVKQTVNNYSDSIESLKFKKAKTEKILLKEAEDSTKIEEKVLLDFYNDIERSLGKIPKEFSELVEFNNKIKKNKIKYYSNRLTEIESQLDNLIQARQNIITENKSIISIINEVNFKEFEKIHKQLLEQSEQLGLLSKVQEIYNDLNKNLEEKTSFYKKINQGSESLDNLSKFNEYLLRYSNEIFNQRLYLTRENSFPLKLSNVDEGLGTGYRKTITLLLDIAYVSFLNELELNYPKFFVHDVLETVDEHNLKKIVGFINANGSQFIFAILNEKIKDYTFIKKEDIRLELSRENKLFKI